MAKLAIILTENIRPSLRGQLTRWMIEPRTGVFVGKLSRRVREKLWDKVCQQKEDGGCMIIYTANNEQRFAMEMAGECRREIVDYDGLTLVRIPGERSPTINTLPTSDLIPGRRPVTPREIDVVPTNPPVPPIPRPFQEEINPPIPTPNPLWPAKITAVSPTTPVAIPAITLGVPRDVPPKKVFHVRMPQTKQSLVIITPSSGVSDPCCGQGAISLDPSVSSFPLPTPTKPPAPGKFRGDSEQEIKFTPYSRKKEKLAPREPKRPSSVLAPVFALPALALPTDLIRGMASPPSYAKGDDYQQAGKVSTRFIDVAAKILRGQVIGGETYDVEVSLFQGKLAGTCSCPVRRNCKHCVALCLEWVRNPGAFDEINVVSLKKSLR